MTTEKRYSKAEKRAIVEAYECSGLTQSGFCLEKGIPYPKFKNWCSQGGLKEASLYGAAPKSSPNKKIGFCQLTPANKEPSLGLPPIRLRMPNGFVLELPSDLPEPRLRSLFTILGVGL
jgi:hypothetical protein